MLEDGVLSQKDYDEYISFMRESNEINLGYSFVTFSHTVKFKAIKIFRMKPSLPL
jgi:hypothetical protein